MFAKEIRMKTQSATLALAVLLVAATAVQAAGGPVAGDDGVTFSLSASDAGSVYLAGDFNSWSASDEPLTDDGKGNWSVTVALDAGTYEYKFVVDGDWREDPGNANKKADPFGGSNSVLIIHADGSLGGVVKAVAAAPAAAAVAVAAKNGKIKVGAPQKVAGGIAFSYRDKGAGAVNLAGSFNGWSADGLPLVNDGKGNWSVVQKLDAGSYEYKFVVDGNWLQDPENSATSADPYGGVNSLVTVDASGNVVAAAEGGTASAANNTLNAKVTMDGRYLTRFEYAKNVAVDVNDESKIDPRYRLQRPSQSVDLNFTTEVSDKAVTYMRMRFDSDQNIIQNNVAAVLDEAHLQIHPGTFTMTTYWNEEIYTGEDFLGLGGDVDLPGTIMHDHLDFGKGSGGVLFDADPWGVRTHALFANVHNQDYYNDPDLFDNLGSDRIGLRFSKRFGKWEVGTPLYAERALVWLDFGSIVGGPSTGIPALDEHRGNSGDTSTWYEIDSFDYDLGVDVSYEMSSRWTARGEILHRNSLQRFVTGNQSDPDNSNGALNLPFLDRKLNTYYAQLDYQPNDHSAFSLSHEHTGMSGASADERLLTYEFSPQSVANKQITFSISESPAVAELDSTELNWTWSGAEDTEVTLWFRNARRRLSYGEIGEATPQDSTVTAHTEKIVYLAGVVRTGDSADRFGQVELEAGHRHANLGVAGMKASESELIVRYDRDLTRSVGFIADIRYIRYSAQGHPDNRQTYDSTTDYINPFIGMRYTPTRTLELVLAYGIDPLDYSIDYQGRQLGRWMARENYRFDHPGATNLDAEDYLKNARFITLRAQLRF